MDTEFWRQLRVPPEPNKPLRVSRGKRIAKKVKSIRDAIVRLIMPGMFLFLVYYHIFMHSPAVPKFYAQLLAGTCLYSGG